MALLRRALVAVFLTMAAGATLRVRNNQTMPRRVGGWRSLSAPGYR